MRKLIVLLLIILFPIASYSQTFKAFGKLSGPEKRFALCHPFAAKKAYPLSRMAANECKILMTDPDFDADGNGGMVDAFRHTFWMALTSQRIGERKALKLGRAHEKGNYKDFLKRRNEDGELPDSVMSVMDLKNNSVGARIGTANKSAHYEELVKIVKDSVLSGKCYKILKDNNKNCLDNQGNIIDLDKYKGVWGIPKVLVESS